jgi:hypothetical protein
MYDFTFAVDKYYKEHFAPKCYFVTLLTMTKGSPALYLRNIEQNDFIPKEAKGVLYDMFCTARVVIRWLRRVARHSYPIQNDCDLSGTPFSEYRQPDSFLIEDNKALYQFKHSDMYNIIQCSLTHSYEMVSEPQPIKNPYTGSVFSVSQLWLIWLRMKRSPMLFTYYMACTNAADFSAKYQALLRTYIIDAYARNMTDSERTAHIHDMMYSMVVNLNGTYEPMMYLDESMVNGTILKSYLVMKYALNPSEREQATLILLFELMKLRLEKNK